MRYYFNMIRRYILVGISILLILNVLIFDSPILAENTEKVQTIEKKIARNYSNKFCNAIGIGVSPESAIRLAIDENKNAKYNPALWLELVRSGDENINKIAEDRLSTFISKEIIEKCGAAIGLSGDKGIDYFNEFFTEVRDYPQEEEIKD